MMGKEENREAWGWLHTRLASGTDPSLSHPHAAPGTGRKVRGYQPRLVCTCVHTHTLPHAAVHNEAMPLRDEAHKGLCQ